MNKNRNTKIIANAVGALSVRNTQEDNRTAPTKQNGITLIALIITIIVMLILVGVSIVIAINGGLFDTTKRAAKGTRAEIDAEQELSNGRVKIGGIWYDSIEDYVGGKQSDNQTDPEKPEEPVTPPPVVDTSIYENAPKDANGLLLVNATYTSDGKTAIVPKGFKIVEGIEGTKSIADGLVIQDKDGNEFVWIPVEVTASDTETEIASFYRSNWANNERTTGLIAGYTEPYASGYTGENTEYVAMVKSVYKNKGFYIGRYEAGSVTERTDKANGTTEMVVKKNQFPYNYVGWGVAMDDYTSDVVDQSSRNQGKGAVYLSKKMYEGKDVGVTSTLCYGIQWDAMLDFIKDEKNVTDSSWGNYKPTDGSGTLKNTGSSDDYSAKNIYDVAGNVYELTMESGGNIGRIDRGGCFADGTAYGSTAYRGSHGSGPNFSREHSGFRTTLYIK